MTFTIQRFAVTLALGVLLANALGADNIPPASAEKARQAVAVLQSEAPPADKAMACKQLAIYGKADAVPLIAPLLADKDLSSWARIALEAIPGKASDEALLAASKTLQGELLVGVINSIGRRRDARAVSALATRLNDPDVEVASAAAVALGNIGGDSAAKALQAALTKSTAPARSAVAQGCIHCAEQFFEARKYAKATKLYDVVREADVPGQRKLEATRGAILARQSKGLPLLLETLRSTDQETFRMGLHTARELPGRKVTEALATELGQIPAERQAPLLLAIADRNDEAVLPTLIASARNGATDLRLQAVAELARLGSPAAVPVLLDLLAEANADVANASQSALANWPDSEVDGPLCSRLPAASGQTRRRLVELAGQRHVVNALPELKRAAHDPDPAIQSAGIKALGETVQADDLGALTDLLARTKNAESTEELQDALEAACERIADKEACTAKLLNAWTASASVARCSLLRGLGVVATAKALGAVETALTDGEPAVSDTAVRVLADWSQPTALDPLFKVFCETSNESHRFLALRGCVRLLEEDGVSTQQKLTTFGELLGRTQRADDRKVILSGLANVKDPGALKLVAPLLADVEVQTEAELAAIKIAESVAAKYPAEAKATATRLQAESKNQLVRDRAAKLLAKAK